jgi:tetratricopeptide (TPR) repeat protein
LQLELGVKVMKNHLLSKWASATSTNTTREEYSVGWNKTGIHLGLYVAIHLQEDTKGEYEVKFNGKKVGKRKFEGKKDYRDFVDTIDLGPLQSPKFSVEIFWTRKKGAWQSTLFVTDDYPNGNVPKRSTEEESPIQFIDLVEDLIEAERLVEATHLIMLILRDNEDLARVYSLFGLILKEQNLIMKAKEAFGTALRLDSDDRIALKQLGIIVLLVDGNLEQATPLLERSVTLDKKEDNKVFFDLILLIVTHLIQRKDEQARRFLESCPIMAPSESWNEAVEILDKFLEFYEKGESSKIEANKGPDFITRLIGEAITKIGIEANRGQHIETVRKLQDTQRRFVAFHNLNV